MTVELKCEKRRCAGTFPGLAACAAASLFSVMTLLPSQVRALASGGPDVAGFSCEIVINSSHEAPRLTGGEITALASTAVSDGLGSAGSGVEDVLTLMKNEKLQVYQSIIRFHDPLLVDGIGIAEYVLKR